MKIIFLTGQNSASNKFKDITPITDANIHLNCIQYALILIFVSFFLGLLSIDNKKH